MKLSIITLVVMSSVLLSGCTNKPINEQTSGSMPETIMMDTQPQTEADEIHSTAVPTLVDNDLESAEAFDEPVENEVNLVFSLTEDGGDYQYYVPDGQAKSELENMVSSLERTDKTRQELSLEWWENFNADYLGIGIYDQEVIWYLHSGGKFLSLAEETYLVTDQELSDFITSVLAEEFNLAPYQLPDIQDIDSAVLRIVDWETKEVMREQAVTDQEQLDAFKKMVTEADNIGVAGAKCPFSGYYLLIELQDGTLLEYAMASDSCDTFFVNGRYYDYNGTDEFNHQKYFEKLLD